MAKVEINQNQITLFRVKPPSPKWFSKADHLVWEYANHLISERYSTLLDGMYTIDQMNLSVVVIYQRYISPIGAYELLANAKKRRWDLGLVALDFPNNPIEIPYPANKCIDKVVEVTPELLTPQDFEDELPPGEYRAKVKTVKFGIDSKGEPTFEVEFEGAEEIDRDEIERLKALAEKKRAKIEAKKREMYKKKGYL